jgi:MFS family permease
VKTQWTLVFAPGLSLFMVALDTNIVVVALPTIAEDFATTPGDVQWVVLGYLLPTLALLIPVGRWLDIVGQRPSFIFGLGGFALASVLVGLAPNLVLLVAMRVLQGVFGTVLLALILIIIFEAVRPQERGRAMGIIATLGPLGAASGPPIGGLLLEAVGWPAIFFVNLPVSLVAIGIAFRTMPGGGGLRLPNADWFLETLLLAGASLLFFGGLTLSESQGPMWLGLWVVVGALLIAWGKRRTAAAVKRLVSTRSFALPLGALVLLPMAAGMIVYLTPFFLTATIEAAPSTVGFTILMLPLAMGLMGPAAGYLVDCIGHTRITLLGTIWVFGALILIAPLSPTWSPESLAWRLVLLGVGIGLFAGPVGSTLMAATPHALMGAASGTTGLARNLGFALGPALATAIWASSGYTLAGMRLSVATAAGAAALALISLAMAAKIAATPSSTPDDSEAGATEFAAGTGERVTEIH